MRYIIPSLRSRCLSLVNHVEGWPITTVTDTTHTTPCSTPPHPPTHCTQVPVLPYLYACHIIFLQTVPQTPSHKCTTSGSHGALLGGVLRQAMQKVSGTLQKTDREFCQTVNCLWTIIFLNVTNYIIYLNTKVSCNIFKKVKLKLKISYNIISALYATLSESLYSNQHK